MKPLTKSQLKKIAMMHAAGVLLSTESIWAFETSNLSKEEIDYLDKVMEKISQGLLNGETPIPDSKQIVDYVRKNYK
jgi:hypothetical protein